MGVGGQGPSDFENAESVYLDELADLLDERSIAISAPSLVSCGLEQQPVGAAGTTNSGTTSNLPLTLSSYGGGPKTITSPSLQPPTSSSGILNATLSRPPPPPQSQSCGLNNTLATATFFPGTTGKQSSDSKTIQRLVNVSSTASSQNLMQPQSMSTTSVVSSNAMSPNMLIASPRAANGSSTVSPGPTPGDSLQRPLKQQQNEQRQVSYFFRNRHEILGTTFALKRSNRVISYV